MASSIVSNIRSIISTNNTIGSIGINISSSSSFISSVAVFFSNYEQMTRCLVYNMDSLLYRTTIKINCTYSTC